jgi:hypothetical protein
VASAVWSSLVKPRIKVRQNGRLRVRVTSGYVSHVAGKVAIQVAKKRFIRYLGGTGRVSVRLPKVKAGGHYVSAKFLGSSTVAPSHVKYVHLTVRKRTKRH